jgi:glycosyltransferase involved in cell wall biosynthesis
MSPLKTKAEYLLDPLYPWTWRVAQRRITAFSPDVVVIQWWTTFWAFAFASLSAFCVRKCIPLIFILHNMLPHEPNPWDAWLARLALRQADLIIAQNPNEENRLLDLLPNVRVRTCEIPLYSAFTGEEINQADARRKLGIASEQRVLLFFGIVRPYKGLHVLLDSLAILKKDGLTHFLIVAGEFWEDEKRYLKVIQQHDLESDVRLVNRYIPNEEVDVLFSATDILVAPYLAGTQSAAVALALGRGLPVILTERIAAGVPAAYHRLTHVVPAGDSAALSRAIQTVFKERPGIELPPLDPEADWMRMVHLIETLG